MQRSKLKYAFHKQSNEMEGYIQKLTEICDQASPKSQMKLDISETEENSRINWSTLNSMLKKNGFNPIELTEFETEEETPNLRSLSETMFEILSNYGKMMQTIKKLNKSLKEQSIFALKLQQLERENQKLKKTIVTNSREDRNELLQQVAEQLSLETLEDLPKVVMAMQRVIATIPQIDSFFKTICEDFQGSNVEDLIQSILVWKHSYEKNEKKLQAILSAIEANGDNAIDRAKGIAHFCNLFQVDSDVKNQVEQVYYFVHEMKVYLAYARKHLGLHPNTDVKTVLEELSNSMSYSSF